MTKINIAVLGQVLEWSVTQITWNILCQWFFIPITIAPFYPTVLGSELGVCAEENSSNKSVKLVKKYLRWP